MSYLSTIPEEIVVGSSIPRFHIPMESNTLGEGIIYDDDHSVSSSMDLRPDQDESAPSTNSVSLVETDRAELAYESSRPDDNNGNNNVSTGISPNPADPRSSVSNRGRRCRQRIQCVFNRCRRLWSCSKQVWIVASAVTLLVVFSIMCVILFTPQSLNPPEENETTSPSTFSILPTTSPPTVSPTTSPTTSMPPSRAPATLSPGAVQEIDSVLSTVSDPSTFDDPNSPQSQARSWLLTQDNLGANNVNVRRLEEKEKDALTDALLIQRYVCVELVYALNISLDTLQTDMYECNWTGFECAYSLPDQPAGTGMGNITNITFINQTLSGQLPSELAQLPYLKRLKLQQNNITGPIPSAWMMMNTSSSQLLSLYHLDLSENQLTGSIPAQFWTSMPELSYVYMYANQFSGPLLEPDAHHEMNRTKHVWLHQNQFNGSFPFWMLKRFTPLEMIKLKNNSLTGNFSWEEEDSSLTMSSPLKHLDVSRNFLKGTLPASLFALPNIVNVSLHTNLFTGTLPSYESSFSSSSLSSATPTTSPASSMILKVLLHSNQLHGTVDEFGKEWSRLVMLTLYNNSLTGTIDNCSDEKWWYLTNVSVDCDVILCNCVLCTCPTSSSATSHSATAAFIIRSRRRRMYVLETCLFLLAMIGAWAFV